MPLIFWDASGLFKRYYEEAGSATVDAIFDVVSPRQMLATIWGYAECYAILHRKRNDRRLTVLTFTQAATRMQEEILTAGDFGLLSVEDAAVLAGLALITRYNLNSNDAAILATYLQYARSLPPDSPECILVAADQRLLRAAQAEGLATLNPELLAEADLPAFLTAHS